MKSVVMIVHDFPPEGSAGVYVRYDLFAICPRRVGGP